LHSYWQGRACCKVEAVVLLLLLLMLFLLLLLLRSSWRKDDPFLGCAWTVLSSFVDCRIGCTLPFFLVLKVKGQVQSLSHELRLLALPILIVPFERTSCF
jgi:hypothetical protein